MFSFLLLAIGSLSLFSFVPSGADEINGDASDSDPMDSSDREDLIDEAYSPAATEENYQTIIGTDEIDFISLDGVLLDGAHDIALGAGQDTLEGALSGLADLGSDDDVFRGATFTNDAIVDAGDGDDLIEVSGVIEDSFFDGNEGDDTISLMPDGYGVGNTVSGGAGDDVLVAALDAAGGHVLYDTGEATLNGGHGEDELTLGWGLADGGDGDDNISLLAEGEAYGGDGNDTITIGGDYNTAHDLFADGGAGNDVIMAEGLGTSVWGGVGDDVLEVNVANFDQVNGDTQPPFEGIKTSGVMIETGDGNDTVSVDAELHIELPDYQGEQDSNVGFYSFEEEDGAQIIATLTDFIVGVDHLEVPADIGAEAHPAPLASYAIVIAPSGAYTDIELSYEAAETGLTATYVIRLLGVTSLSPEDLTVCT